MSDTVKHKIITHPKRGNNSIAPAGYRIIMGPTKQKTFRNINKLKTFYYNT